MQKIIDYWTCTSPDDCDLDNLVNEKIREGYQPYGQPFMIPMKDNSLEDLMAEMGVDRPVEIGYHPNFAQAMVKYESEEKS